MCGEISNVPLNHVDIAPTTLGLCGIEPPEYMEGFDYSHRRLGYRDKEPVPEPESAYLQLVIPPGDPHTINKAYRGIVTRDGFKFCCFENMEWLLFDLNNDPYELVNLAHNSLYSLKIQELKAELRNWAIKTGDNFMVPM